MSGADVFEDEGVVGVTDDDGDDPHPIFFAIERQERREQRRKEKLKKIEEQEAAAGKNNNNTDDSTVKSKVSFNEMSLTASSVNDGTAEARRKAQNMPRPSVRFNDGDDHDPNNPNLLPLKSDMYAFIAMEPVFSKPFAFALYIIFGKFIILAMLITGIKFDGNLGNSNILDDVVKFLLIPIAVAMQEDLMEVFATAANLVYDESVLNVAPSCTKCKVIFACFLRFIDGMMNLYANFSLMLITNGTLNILLNFAALHFLQGIDDVVYELTEKGFFGDKMEYQCVLCNKISFPRRFVTNTDCLGIITTDTDAGMLWLTMMLLLVVYILYVSPVIDTIDVIVV